MTEPKTRDLVIVRGIEPSMRWRSYCNELLGFAHELGVELVVILGALLGDTPHSRPVPVSGVTSDADWPARWTWRRAATRARPASSECSRRRARTRACRP